MGLSLHVLVKFPMGYVRDDYGEGKALRIQALFRVQTRKGSH